MIQRESNSACVGIGNGLCTFDVIELGDFKRITCLINQILAFLRKPDGEVLNIVLRRKLNCNVILRRIRVNDIVFRCFRLNDAVGFFVSTVKRNECLVLTRTFSRFRYSCSGYHNPLAVNLVMNFKFRTGQ